MSLYSWMLQEVLLDALWKYALSMGFPSLSWRALVSAPFSALLLWGGVAVGMTEHGLIRDFQPSIR